MKRKPATLKRAACSAAFMLLLTAAVFCVLPRVLPYEKINVLYGLSQGSDHHFIEALPAGSGDQEVYLMMDNLMNLPEASLVVNGRPYCAVTKEQTDARIPVRFASSLLAEPGELQLSLSFHYGPLIRLTTNVITLPVLSPEEMT